MDGIKQLQSKLRGLGKQSGQANVTAVAGYVQTYTFPVHEDLTARHAAGTSAKFLEIPAVSMRSELREQIAKNTDGFNLTGPLLGAARSLLAASQPLVPVDTGALKASGFACLERDLDAVSAEAFNRSEGIRLSGKK